MYDPTIGRWFQEDPIGFEAGDANKNRYVGNNPTNMVDPTGLYMVSADKNAAEAFVKELNAGKEVKIHTLTSGRVFIDKESSIYKPFFAFADKQWPMTFDMKTKQDDPKKWEAEAKARNAFLFSFGFGGPQLADQLHLSLSKADAGGLTFSPVNLAADELKEIRAIFKEREFGVTVDLGGTGRYGGTGPVVTLNVNVTPISDFPGLIGKPIPYFVYGDAGALPFPAKSVSSMIAESMDITDAWAKEMYRERRVVKS